ncbi:pro-sigmaK processing inhibitor BofA family protein [Methanothermobacter wolfeii]|uniref:pro-sigmaK processing inhibitor BofA family protein n=1 Tax=Methanothermobacter wolfeii TaxID=145261 RepID=UPI0024B35722|nr:pro-sigmaK processing inhibitor BofA family protein [Methanothermobacter wolfeii]MDI6702543.1 pro-sigmaK processing inhibitor BofA family protein [Methanothermobacter wolfeii]
METMSLLILVVLGTFLIAGGLALLRVLLRVGRTLITVAANMLTGLVILICVNMLPFINLPLNLLTILVAGFGGIAGVGILIIGNIAGFI